MIYQFEFPGEPVGDQRARTVKKKSGGTMTFTPDKPGRWKADALAHLERKWKGLPIVGPLDVHVLAVLKRPQRLQRKKDPDSRLWAADAEKGSKPDEDNVLKLVQDTLVQAGVIVDDSFVVSGTCVKVYQGIRSQLELPHVQVWITPLGDQAPPEGGLR